MHISALQILGYGQLSDVLLEGLAPGLNVIYGPNGSGKSTLLQFVRGVLLGFDESRQFGLLPPRDWSPNVRRQAGGSISLIDGPCKVGIVRTAGVDAVDHLGVRIQDGRDLDAGEYRHRVRKLDPDFVKLLLAVGTSEAHSIDAMLTLARRDGLALSPTVCESDAHQARVEDIRRQREQLVGSDDSEADQTTGTLARLDRQRREMAESLETARQHVITRFRSLLDREQELSLLLDELSADVHWHDLELQACQQDLRAAEDELWAIQAQAVESTAVSECDERILRARHMLRDLADARHQFSTEIADRLVTLPTTSEPVTQHAILRIDRLREDRDQLDRCEHEVAEYLRRITARRSSGIETMFQQSDKGAAPSVVPLAETMRQQRIETLTAQVRSLQEARGAMTECYQAACAQWCNAVERQRRIRGERLALAADDGLDVLRLQLQEFEQEWQHIYDDWQALTLAEAALKRVQSSERMETPAKVIEHASRLFQRLTQGGYRELRYLTDPGSLVAVSSSAETRNLESLSRGTLDQAALSLRLALLSAYAEQGVRWPVVLDEVLVDSDLERLRLAAALLHEFSLSSQQIIYLTCLEHLVDVLQTAGARILHMPGFEPETRHSAPPRLAGPHWLSTREESRPAESRQLLITQSIPPRSLATAPANEPTGAIAQPAALQPTGSHWLTGDSPLSLAPSISPQMASELSAMGIRTVAELLTFDEESAGGAESTFSPGQLRIWRAEIELLLRVPRLTGRDAQLLVSAGILSAEHLAGETPESLMRRLDRLRGSSLDEGPLLGWPRHADLRHWIANARGATPTNQVIAPSQSPHHEQATAEATVADPDADSQRRPASEEGALRFYLDLTSPIVDAPSIGPTTARKLSRLGIHTVSDLLHRDAVVIADRLGDRRVTSATVIVWQQQAGLMVRVPELRGHDVQVLVACGIMDPESLAASRPEDLFAKVGPFVATSEGQRLLRSARKPDLNEVTDWILWSRQARSLRAA